MKCFIETAVLFTSEFEALKKAFRGNPNQK